MGAHTLALLGIFLAGCADGNQGAASVRWRIVDLDSAIGYDPRAQGQPDGSCSGPSLLDATGAAVPAWVVHNIRLTVNDPITLAPVPIDPPGAVLFSCRQREATTTFRIPLGRFAFDLCPFSSDPAICDEGVTPAPSIRIVRKAEIINLDVIEIGVRPPPPNSTAPPPDLAGIDAAGPP